jgi:putative transposase
MIRNSLKFVSFKDRRAVTAALMPNYPATNEEQALAAVDDFAKQWDARYPMISRSWKTRWTEVAPFLSYPEEIRRVINTTNGIESVNYSLRKVTNNRLSFPNSDAVMKLVFMALQNIAKKWTMPIKEWNRALGQLATLFGDRVPA